MPSRFRHKAVAFSDALLKAIMAKKKKAPPPEPFARLCLVTPAGLDPEAFAPMLDAVLKAGDVATLFIVSETSNAAELQRIAEALVPVAHANGVAAIVPNDTRLFGRARADGLHVEFVALRSAIWNHAAGPVAAVTEANALIAARQAEATE